MEKPEKSIVKYTVSDPHTVNISVNNRDFSGYTSFIVYNTGEKAVGYHVTERYSKKKYDILFPYGKGSVAEVQEKLRTITTPIPNNVRDRHEWSKNNDKAR